MPNFMTNFFSYNKVIFLVTMQFLSCAGHAQDFNGGLMAGLVGSQVAGDTYSGYNKAGLFLGVLTALQQAVTHGKDGRLSAVGYI